MLRAVFFDVDGTLVDSISYCIFAIKKGFESFGIKIDEKEIKKRIGMRLYDIFKSLNKIYPEINGISFEEFKKTVDKIYLRNIKHIKTNPGCKNLLSFLKENNIKLVVTSSAPRYSVMKVLKNNGILNYFDCILTAEDVIKAKPDPEIYQKAIQILNLKPENCLAIDDSPYGILAAKRANIKAFAVLTGVGTLETLTKYQPDKIFKNLEEIYLYFLSNKLLQV